MKRFLMLSSSAFLSIVATGAYAADAISAQEPVPAYVAPISAVPAFTWSGAYIGGQIDYSMSKGKFSYGNSPEAKGTGKGFLGGLYTGYNFDIGNNLILGTELDFSAGFNKKKANDKFGASPYASSEIRWSGAARARVGYAADRFLPYIAGGLAFGDIKDRLKTADSTFTKDKTRTGWTIGGGVDYAATDNVILRLEYRYTDFGKQSFDLGNSTNYSRKLSTNDIRVGVAYKF
ncbi:porin family protein [Brucella sp. 21LCYQ03]|nr:porin family protein [Brucella sp. 21LCYQ03]